MNALKGYRSYALAAFGGLATVAAILGIIDAEMWAYAMGIAGAGGLATLRAAAPK